MYEEPRISIFIKTESRIEVNQGLGEGGIGVVVEYGYRVSVWTDEKFLWVSGSEPMVSMSLMPLNCTLKYGEDGKFCVMYILLPKKKKKQRENLGGRWGKKVQSY